MAGITHKDTTFTKLFVGGLPYHTTDDTLKAHFDKYGEIEEAVVITDRVTNKSKGYGFVTMADAESAKLAIADPNPVIDGRKANVNLAYLGAKPRGVQALNPAAFLKPGLIAPQLGLSPFLLPTLGGGMQLPQAQQFLLQQQSQISPTTAATTPSQYPAFVDYNSLLQPPAGMTPAEYFATPSALAGTYPTLPPNLGMSFPQNITAASLANLQLQQQIQQGDGRLQ